MIDNLRSYGEKKMDYWHNFDVIFCWGVRGEAK